MGEWGGDIQVVLAFLSISFHSCKVGLSCSLTQIASWSKAFAKKHYWEVAVKSWERSSVLSVPSLRLSRHPDLCHCGRVEALLLSPLAFADSPNLDRPCWLWDVQASSLSPYLHIWSFDTWRQWRG